MHVVQFIHRYPPALGGAEAWTERLSKHLIAQGHQVSVWTTTAQDLSAFTSRGHREFPPGETTQDGVTVRRYQPKFRFPGRRYIFKALSLFPIRPWQARTVPWTPISLRMWKDSGKERSKVDVVHALAFPHSSLSMCALRLARKQKARFVLTPFLHLGDLSEPRNWIRRAYTSPHLRWLLRQADCILVQTPSERDAVREIGIAESKIMLQGLGVEPSECTGGDRARARQMWNVRDDEIVVGHLANLSMEKGSPDVLCTVEELRNAGLPIRAVLAGTAMPSFTKFQKWTGPSDWFTLTGPLNDEQRRDFFAGIDVFAMPSISDSFGLVFLEAWANGVPVIGYRAGGVADVIRHEHDGLLVPCANLTELAHAIRRIACDPPLRRRWGDAGRERLVRDFRWMDKLGIAARALTGS